MSEENNIFKPLLKKAVLSQPRRFVQTWMVVNEVTWDTKQRPVLNGTCIKSSALFEKLFLDLNDIVKEYNKKNKNSRISTPRKELMDMAFRSYLDEKAKKLIKKYRDHIAHNSELNLDELKQFVKATTGNIEDLDLYAFAHLLWQVKRKMNRRKVKQHLMIIVTGKQGSGKSTAVEQLVNPIEPFVASLAVDQMVDNRCYQVFEENFIIINDEVQGLVRTDINQLKHLITAPYLQARRLHTHIMDKYQQNCTFIGTSNKELFELINDNTGLRRFHGVTSLDQMDWGTINGIDYEKIWRSINENCDKGYFAFNKGPVTRKAKCKHTKG